MDSSAAKLLIAACLGIYLPSLALAQDSSSSSSTSPNYSFSVGSRPADIGTGFSTYSATSATADQSFHVECNCHDFTLVTATCPAPRYECYCNPSASLTCE